MAKSKAVQAKEFFNYLVESGHMLYIGPSGAARCSPTLQADDYDKLAWLNKEIVEIIRGQNDNSGTEGITS